jgi:hypothetical protein
MVRKMRRVEERRNERCSWKKAEDGRGYMGRRIVVIVGEKSVRRSVVGFQRNRF